MKSILKYIVASFGVVALMAACSVENEGAIYSDNGAASFLSTASTYSLSAAATSIEVQVNRTTTKGSATYPLTATDKSGGFNAPTEVSFADGEGSTMLTVGLKDGMEVGVRYDLVLSLGDKVSAGGNASITLRVTKNYEWTAIGTGKWTDGLVGPLFGASALTYDVTVYGANGVSGVYSVMPYAYGVFPYTAENEVVGTGRVIVDARNPESVFVAEAGTGINWSYGEMIIGSVYGNKSNDLATYPLGKVNGKTIDLGSMYIEDDDGVYVIGQPVILVLP
ncbi:MAG: hypothetical protein LBM61_03095 [Prevotellaceae bacterium]|jgi:hypothetical protein|nr:hypothetical protein [Prevotellaceae bacterium]